MSTRGIQFLKQKKVPFAVVTYEHQEKGAQFAAQAVGFPLAQTIKTLVVALDGAGYCLVLIPGDQQLSMKKVAEARRAKKATMADTATAERLTGYQVGGISPFGIKKQMPVMMEARLEAHAHVLINAGQRGVMVKLASANLIKVLNAAVADLIHV